MKKKKKLYKYDDQEDAFLSGYAEAFEVVIKTLIREGAFTDDFLYWVLMDYIKKNKNYD